MSRLADLVERIERRDVTVGVLGLGYVGLPLAMAFVEAGARVLGFDTDGEKIAKLRSGHSYVLSITDESIALAQRSARFEATDDLSRLAEPDALLICVPTPVTRHREPDLTAVRLTAEAIAQRLRSGQLVVLESTTYPGCTEDLVAPILRRSGLEIGGDAGFGLAFSPEREEPGNQKFRIGNIPKVVGGVDDESARAACALYSLVAPQVVRVSSTQVAEAAKLTENIFRAVNIALVNELKIIYDAMGIDVREVLDAAATKPFGFMRFDPGPGWGGHCIPVDPFYLAWKAREYGEAAQFIELAGRINIEMPRWVVAKVVTALSDNGKPLRGSRVLLLGLAYKRDVPDPRESPAFEIFRLLREGGAVVAYHDPLIDESPPMRHWPEAEAMRSLPLTATVLAAQDAVVIVTDHTSVDYDLVVSAAPVIVDTRGVYPPGTKKVFPA